jgi:hypothetical protein
LKFKYLLIAFSIIIVIVILIAALLPLFLSGPQSAANLRYITLPLLLFIAVLLVCISVFFLFNYRLFSLLEREDWPALAYYLEQKIFVKNRYSARYVRLLASSYLVISDYPSVQKLESKVMLARPSLLDKNILIFGPAKILCGKQKEAVAFFGSRMEKRSVKEKQWVRWYYGFSNLLSGAFDLAEPEFAALAVSSSDALITGLSAYFLSSSIEKHSKKPEECRGTAETGRSRIVKTLNTAEDWKKEADQLGTEIHIAIIRKYIDEAGKWLFDNSQAEVEGEAEKEEEKKEKEEGGAEE